MVVEGVMSPSYQLATKNDSFYRFLAPNQRRQKLKVSPQRGSVFSSKVGVKGLANVSPAMTWCNVEIFGLVLLKVVIQTTIFVVPVSQRVPLVVPGYSVTLVVVVAVVVVVVVVAVVAAVVVVVVVVVAVVSSPLLAVFSCSLAQFSPVAS